MGPLNSMRFTVSLYLLFSIINACVRVCVCMYRIAFDNPSVIASRCLTAMVGAKLACRVRNQMQSYGYVVYGT